MHQRRLLRRLAATFLAMVLLTGLIVPASAANWNMTYFLRKYSDWHFDLSKSPNNPMTYEEYIAIAYAYSYYGDGTTATPAADSTGKTPSAWAARYVQAEVAKKTITPSEVTTLPMLRWRMWRSSSPVQRASMHMTTTTCTLSPAHPVCPLRTRCT